MAHESMFTRNRRPLLVMLLGALACSDGMSSSAAPGGPSPAPNPAAEPPAAAESPAAESPEAMQPADAPAGSSAAPDGAGAAEGVGSSPIDLDGASSPSAGAGDDGAASSEAPSSAEPAAPAADEPSEPSLARGAEPTRESATAPGPFPVTTLTTGLRDGPEYGSQTLHVPEGVEPPWAAVAIVPGFNTPESSIAAWGPFLASHGIVTLTIGTNTPGDSAEVRARAVLDALVTIEAENVRAGSPLEGNLALDHLGIMGWSLGGGGVLIAAERTPSLRAAITMAAFAPGGQFADNQVPTLLLAGSADPNAGGQSQGLFTSFPETTPKMLFEVMNGPHEVGNDPANANGEIGLYGLSWLEVFLVGDERYRQFLEAAPSQASDFRENLTGAP